MILSYKEAEARKTHLGLLRIPKYVSNPIVALLSSPSLHRTHCAVVKGIAEPGPVYKLYV